MTIVSMTTPPGDRRAAAALRRPPSHPAADRGPRIDWQAVRRLVVVRPDNIGDVVMSGPAIRALRAAAPQARVTLLASPSGAQVAPYLPGVDDVLAVSPVWQDAGEPRLADPAAEDALVARLREGRHEVMVVFTSFSQSPWPPANAGFRAGIPVRIGHSKEFGGSLLSHWITSPADDLHHVDRALHLLEAVGVPPRGGQLELALPAATTRVATAALAAAGLTAPYAVLAPGATCQARRYPEPRWARVARDLADRGLTVAVTGSRRERALVEAVVRGAGRPDRVAAVGDLGVGELAALIAGAQVLLGNDSGPMHLADAVGSPVVCAFSGTDLIAQVGPRGVPAVLLREDTTCTPCRQFTCPYDLQCLDIDPGEFVEAAFSLLPRRREALCTR